MDELHHNSKLIKPFNINIAEETIQDKFSFEQFSTSNGVNVHAYHADNR